MQKSKLLIAVFVCAVIFSGCAKKAQETGFLSTYNNLEKISSDTMRYISPQAAQYSKFIIEPVEVKFFDDKAAAKATPEDMKRLKEYFYDQITKQKPDRYQIVSEPGPGVAKLRLAITNLKKSKPVLNILPQTKLVGVGLGQASVEMEALDSQSSEQVAAAIVSQTGSRLSLSGLTKWGDVEAVMKKWAKRIWQRVDEAHGIETK